MRRGFTTMEWLVIAVIAGALAAILFPCLPREHCDARAEDCSGQLKLLGRALQLYAEDCDDRLPPAASWQDGLQPYTQRADSFACPADLRMERGIAGSYAWNRFLDGPRLSQVAVPVETPVLFDANAPGRNFASEGLDYAPRHRGRAARLYLDGHTRVERHLQLTPVTLLPKPWVGSPERGDRR